MTPQKLRLISLGVLAALVVPPGFAQSARDLQDLRKDIEELKASQKEIQKNVQIVKDILMGKPAPLENVFITTDGEPAVGEKTAKVTMVEFSDYQCPFCGRYFSQTLPQVMDEYVKTGKIRYVFRDFPLESIHPFAEKAGEAAHCAGEQGKYWEMHDRLYKNQQQLDPKELAGHATVLDLDVAKFQKCLDSGEFTKVVKKNEEDGQKLGLKGTPGFYVGISDAKDGQMHAVKFLNGALPFSAFKEALDNLLNPPKKDEADKEKSTK
jgi:protein-disulfide isomerase